MGINYDKYIKRLREKRLDNPEYAFYRQTMQSMVEPLKSMNYEMQGRMNMAGGSIGAMAQAGLSAQQQLQGTASSLYGQADRSAMQYNDKLDSQIMGLEMQQEQQAEAEKAEKDQKKNGLLKTIITGGLTAAGAIAGSVIPGAGTVLGGAAGGSLAGALFGAQAGAAVGGIASGFVGGGGGYGLQYADEGQIMQGIGDTLAGISAASTLKEQRDFAKLFSTTYQSMTLDQKESLYKAFLLGGYPAAREILMKLSAPASTLTLPDISNQAMAGVTA